MTKKSLKLIKGGRSKSVLFSGVKLVVTTREALPDDAEIMVFEEDTKMVLTVDKEVLYQEEHIIRTMTDIYNAPGHIPGSLVIQGKSWYALVIDLDAGVMCQSHWIEEAYREIFSSLDRRGIVTAGMHLLGSIYGKIPVEKALGMLYAGLKNRTFSPLKKIYLVVNIAEVKDTWRHVVKYINR